MTMYDEYDFVVKPGKKAGEGPIPVFPVYSGGSMTASRSFSVPCENAMEFAFRMMGRFFDEGTYEDPVLPVEFPWDDDSYTMMARMFAIGYSITPLCENCLNADFGEDESGPRDGLQFPQSFEYLEKYYGGAETDCDCIVKIDYATPPWNCTWADLGDAILENTAIRVDRNPSYELFTVPSRTLVWADKGEGPDRILKGDSHATILVPKADITIDWYNIPVRRLCDIEIYLNQFRGTVNSDVFGGFLDCESYSAGSCSAANGNIYEAETLLFIDWEEIDQYRTSSFRFMDSTAVRIHLKQKRIVDPVSELVKGWNHSLIDSTAGDGPSEMWQRVAQLVNGSEEPMFPLKSWTNLLNPTLT